MKEMIAYQIEKHDSSTESDSYVSDIFSVEETVKRISFALYIDKQSITVKIEPDDKEPLKHYLPRLSLDHAYPGSYPFPPMSTGRMDIYIDGYGCYRHYVYIVLPLQIGSSMQQYVFKFIRAAEGETWHDVETRELIGKPFTAETMNIVGGKLYGTQGDYIWSGENFCYSGA